jgi:hypothetical protein
MTDRWILELEKWRWEKYDHSTAKERGSEWRAVAIVYSKRLVRATEHPARLVLTIRCICGKRMGQVMKTSEGYLALAQVRRPNPFPKEARPDSKVPAERVLDPYFLDDVDDFIPFVCSRHGPHDPVESRVLMEGIEAKSQDIFLGLPESKTFS